MTQLIIGAETLKKLRDVQEQVELLDESGNLVGYFTPPTLNDLYTSARSPIGDEEIRRRAQHGRGRKLEDILADLERGS